MGGLNDYFSFSKRERTGAITLIILIVIIYLLPAFFPTPKALLDPKTVAEIREQMAALRKNYSDSSESVSGNTMNEYYVSDYEPSNEERPKKLLFYFDPNTLSAEGWKKLGINDRTIQTIGKYISRGGQFRKSEDIKKIYGLRKGDYEQLLPFVRIKNNEEEKKQHDTIHAKPPVYNKTGVHSFAIIDINAADTSVLIALPGIGTRLANRILTFREKLGGFYSVDQIKETFGLPDSTFQRIKPFLKCDDSHIRQVNINSADAETLKHHPYIKWNIANAIVSYRQQHGDYTSLEELLKIDIISPETLQKLIPYLKVN